MDKGEGGETKGIRKERKFPKPSIEANAGGGKTPRARSVHAKIGSRMARRPLVSREKLKVESGSVCGGRRGAPNNNLRGDSVRTRHESSDCCEDHPTILASTVYSDTTLYMILSIQSLELAFSSLSDLLEYSFKT